VFLSGSLITWKTKKQATISHSSAEAELWTMTLATTEVTWLQWLLEDLGICVSVLTPLLSDSTGALSIALTQSNMSLLCILVLMPLILGHMYEMMLLSFTLCLCALSALVGRFLHESCFFLSKLSLCDP
jgi:hypothetical protein